LPLCWRHTSLPERTLGYFSGCYGLFSLLFLPSWTPRFILSSPLSPRLPLVLKKGRALCSFRLPLFFSFELLLFDTSGLTQISFHLGEIHYRFVATEFSASWCSSVSFFVITTSFFLSSRPTFSCWGISLFHPCVGCSFEALSFHFFPFNGCPTSVEEGVGFPRIKFLSLLHAFWSAFFFFFFPPFE